MEKREIFNLIAMGLITGALIFAILTIGNLAAYDAKISLYGLIALIAAIIIIPKLD